MALSAGRRVIRSGQPFPACRRPGALTAGSHVERWWGGLRRRAHERSVLTRGFRQPAPGHTRGRTTRAPGLCHPRSVAARIRPHISARRSVGPSKMLDGLLEEPALDVDDALEPDGHGTVRRGWRALARRLGAGGEHHGHRHCPRQPPHRSAPPRWPCHQHLDAVPPQPVRRGPLTLMDCYISPKS